METAQATMNLMGDEIGELRKYIGASASFFLRLVVVTDASLAVCQWR
jgi:hypothetical protein